VLAQRIDMRPLLIALASFVCLAASHPALATVLVRDAWIRSPPPGAQTAAGYAVLVNHSIATDRLTGGR
jgi:copper(I)-binding protein